MVSISLWVVTGLFALGQKILQGPALYGLVAVFQTGDVAHPVQAEVTKAVAQLIVK